MNKKNRTGHLSFSFAALAVAALFSFTPQAHAALVGHWTLDSNDFDWNTGEVYDTSGNGNNGTVHNLTSDDETTGQVDGGLQFDGTDSYISVPVNGAFPPSGNSSRTVCLWFKPTDDSWTPDVNSIFEYGVGGDSFGIDMDNFPNIQFYTWHNDDLLAMGIAGHEDDWLQICWVWDSSTDSSIFYSNGVYRGEKTFGSSINTPQTVVNIGRSSLTSGYFPGIIDDVRIYDTAFTSDEVTGLYESSVNPAAIQSLASTTGETTATVTWDTATSSDSTLWYGTSSGSYTMSTTSATLVTSHSLSIAGLSSLTPYYFVVVSNDGVGDIATSSEATFTTVDLTPPTLSAIVATSTASTTADITWTTNENASTKAVFGLTSAYDSTTLETDTSPRVTSHTDSLASLLACTTYHYAVVSRDASLNSATSSDATFTTQGCTASSTPTASNSGTITSSSGGTTDLTTDNKTFEVSAPANATATSSSFVIQIQALPSSPVIGAIGTPNAAPNLVGATIFDVKAIINGSTILDSFDTPITISYQYTDAEITDLDENTLKLYHYHDGSWQALNDCSVDTSTNTITCTTPSFSDFGLFGQSKSTTTSSASSGGGSFPWCSGPSAPGWNSSLPDGGCGVAMTQATAGAMCPAYSFTRLLKYGSQGEDVRNLQTLMNCLGFTLAQSGPGSVGNETIYFSSRTLAAVDAFQQTYAADILTPVGAASPTGIFATYSQKKAAGLTGSSGQ